MKKPLIVSLLFLFICNQVVSAQVTESDSNALVAIYNDMDGPNWTDNTGWLNGPVADWFGIEISEGQVTEINLQNNNLTGDFPAIIGDLGALKVLSMSLNNITGTIPDEIGGLAKLEELLVSKNNIVGAIPASIGQLSNLRTLLLLSNQLEGPLPDLGGLDSLRSLNIGRNEITETFPNWILQLTNLEDINLNNVGMAGVIPENLFSSLPNLRAIKIASNQLSGDVGEWYKDADNLEEFEIYNNKFSGSFKENSVNVEINKWSIGSNEIEGIPDFSTAQEMKGWFYIDDNKLGFHELEKAKLVVAFDESRLSLGPQKSLMEEEEIVVTPGESILISAGSFGLMDTYQWYKDGNLVAGAEDSELLISSFAPEDAGVYHAIIGHPNYDFDLERSTVTLVSGEVSNIVDLLGNKISLSPNPASDVIKIQGATPQRIEVYDLTGRKVLTSKGSNLDLQALQLGTHFVKIEVDGAYVWRKILKI